MAPTDFEELLRETLQARAQDVTPNPETWSRVEGRLRRRQQLRWALAGVTAAAAVVLAAVAVPSLLTPTRVDLSPADEAPAEPPEETPAEPVEPQQPAAELPEGLAATTGHELVVFGEDLCAGTACGEEGVAPIDRFAVRPGSDAEVAHVAVQREERCGTDGFPVLSGNPGQLRETTVPVTAGTCVGAPVWSPDGDFLAWIESPEDDQRSPSLVVRGFTDEGVGTGETATDNATFALELPAEHAGADLTDWVWTARDGDAARGLLHLNLWTGHGQSGVATLEVERQADGAFALPHGGGLNFDAGSSDFTPLLRVSGDDGDGDDDDGAPMYQLAHTAGGLELGRFDDEGVVAVEVDLDTQQHDVWLTAAGNRVAFGERGGRAFTAEWNGADAWLVEPLPAGTRHAEWLADDADDAVAPSAGPQSADAGDDTAIEPPLSEPPFIDGIPAPVEATRERIRLAAGNGDIDGLVALMPADFSSSFGRDPGPEEGRAELEAMIERGEDPFGLLLELLAEEPAESDGLYAWPAAHLESEGFLGHRVGIAADGTWRFFVAGD